MARTCLLVAVLLLALTENRTDCSTATAEKRKFNCNTATYTDVSLVDFVQDCAPVNWKAFFDRPDVQNAIKPIAKYLKGQANKKNNDMTIQIEPPMKDIFKALEMVNGQARVVILGQDPTPLEGKATGLAFSVQDPRTVPSVMNVLMEVALEGWSVDLNCGDLSKWAKQGVLLLNSALTVEIRCVKKPKKVETRLKKVIKKAKKKVKTKLKKNKKKPAKNTRAKMVSKKPTEYSWSKSVVKHTNCWSQFMKLLIGHLTTPPLLALPYPSLVWMLWGKDAQDLADPLIPKRPDQYIIRGGHPSPRAYSSLFLGGNYFHCANEFLKKQGLEKINWGLVEKKNARLHTINSGLKPCPKF